MGNTDKFDRMASVYDTPERIQIAKLSADAIGECLKDITARTAMDFGCGTGLVGMNLINHFESILFLDTSQNMISVVCQKISDLQIYNADALCFDFEQDNTANVHVDCIFMAQVLLHIADFQPVLRKLYDTLNPGGHLIIVDFDENVEITSELVHNGFDQEELAKRMTELGFANIRSRTFHHGSKIFMNQDASMFVLDAQK